GSATAATHELTLTYLVRRADTSHATSATAPAAVSTGNTPSIAPSPVATPLPPFRRSHTGNMCPSSAAAATPRHSQSSADPQKPRASGPPSPAPAPPIIPIAAP